jgi:hypothetical protein
MLLARDSEASVLNLGSLQWTPRAVALLLARVSEASVLNAGGLQWTPIVVALLLTCVKEGERFECGLSAVDMDSCGAAGALCGGGDRFASQPGHRLSHRFIRCFPDSFQATTEHSTMFDHNRSPPHIF